MSTNIVDGFLNFVIPKYNPSVKSISSIDLSRSRKRLMSLVNKSTIPCYSKLTYDVVSFFFYRNHSGFKARMTFENCLETRNQTLMQLFATPDIDSLQLAGNTIGTDGRQLSAVLQELPVCDLQRELDNVWEIMMQVALFIICESIVKYH